jgi:hypothetical protein
MSDHSYTAQQALEVLMKKLRERDETLAAHVQAAIDIGKDVSESLPATRSRKKTHIFRKTVAFTHEEALQVAMNALQAYFVEQPLFIDEAAKNFAEAGLGAQASGQFQFQISDEEREPVKIEHLGDEKQIEIELQTETQISRTGEETVSLIRTVKSQIEEQQRNIARLRTLADFTKE